MTEWPDEVRAKAVFAETFGAEPEAVASAPARANLMGEHTDYNDGLVLPVPLADRTAIAVARHGDPGMVDAVSDTLGVRVQANLEAGRRGDWLDYVLGCVQGLTDRGEAVTGLRLAVAGSVALGAGISSSAALEVSTLRALRTLLGLDLSDRTLALLGQQAERDFVGMPCGIMDQMVSAKGLPGHALFLDTRDLSMRTIPLPAGVRLAVVHSGVSHKLVDGGYESRVRECRAACRFLGVDSLRDLGRDDLARIEGLEAPLDRRARHVITENDRVEAAAAALVGGDVDRLGQLMLDSHASQRDDYAVSVPEVDRLQKAAMDAGAIGARLTGGGFGGSIIAAVAEDRFEAWQAALSASVPDSRPVATIGAG